MASCTAVPFLVHLRWYGCNANSGTGNPCANLYNSRSHLPAPLGLNFGNATLCLTVDSAATSCSFCFNNSVSISTSGKTLGIE